MTTVRIPRKTCNGASAYLFLHLSCKKRHNFSVEVLVSAYARTLALERCNIKTFLIWGNLTVFAFKMKVLLSQPDDM